MKKSITYCDDCNKELNDKNTCNLIDSIDICNNCIIRRYKFSLHYCPTGKILCEVCKGKGSIREKEYLYHNDYNISTIECPECHGELYSI